jgi:hypothetical protein
MRNYNIYYLLHKYDDAWVMWVNGVHIEVELLPSGNFVLWGLDKHYYFDDFFDLIEAMDISLMEMENKTEINN